MFASAFDPDKPSRTLIAGVSAGHDARVLADIALRTRGRPVVHVALDDVGAAVLADALAFFAPHVEVLPFPGWDCLPYDRVSPHPDVMGQRLATLSRLQQPFTKPCVLLTIVQAIGQKTLPQEALREASLSLAIGDEKPVEELRRFLAGSGYNAASTVREAGEFAVRGGIVDLFPPGYDNPVRLDYFGDEIDAIRQFDPLTQTTIAKIDFLQLRPVSEALMNERTIALFRSGYRELFGAVTENDPLYESVTAGRQFPGMEHWLGLFYAHLASLFDYAPQSPVIFETQVDEAYQSRTQQVEDFYQARLSLFEASRRNKKKGQGVIAYKPVPIDRLYMDQTALDFALQDRALATFSPFAVVADAAIDAGGARGRDFADARARPEDGLYAALRAYAAEQQALGRRVALACYSQGSAERLAGLLRTHGLDSIANAKSWDEARKLDIKTIALFVLGLEHGFTAPDLALITEQDILGDRLIRPARKRRAAAAFQLELGSLNVGDFVVHAEHGIGRYEGLEAIHALGADHDCVKLVYDGGDKLYVPVENLDVLTRYGSAESGAVLDRLGSAAWQARKARVKKRLKDMADELLKIAAERHLKEGELIQAPEGAYQEFAARFPYAETEDQIHAIDETLRDLASGKPMDRLVCGDVGFGKTEVALRAAFAAVQAGLQVAVVVPTTLLARQHYNNFIERFAAFPVRIAQLSRMVTAGEAKRTKEMLKDGHVDIVIGTHALLSSDIGFQRLGLLVIDEEQHFGVKQKERLKQLRADVHVLTLTATPIPRTLQLALTGVRELSLMASPPVDRLSVRTFVLPYDPMVIREALMREHYRGGQSFYVCPRIEDLKDVLAGLKELVPEAKVIMAHGRMSPSELDDIMTAFDAKKFDVLLATNIVESGLDIPNANTIVIHRSDMFGLAQLYQLRGRIGRAKKRGYAYLTYAAGAPISATALKRLEVIQTLDQLGAGFQLASHDMDIRGAGNLLGEEQSGHIREVGVELYQQMLEDAVAAARAGGLPEETVERWTPQINIGLSVLIPETYVSDLNVRMSLYRRLAEGADGEAIESIAAEMIDRFGPLPLEVENLLQTVAIKNMCRLAGIAKLDAGPKGAVIGFHQDKVVHPEKLIAWISRQAGTARVRPDQKLVLMRAWASLEQRLNNLKAFLAELIDLAR
jgi:transcription-repair coupling factor (superfamily II helicase)